ncbi:Cytochrome c oxidase subunit 3 [Folsomia candida]|uniref:Cytochrome c oxidase subunit 3 n=1 Tax=Folsomia candida TaxID=158441 RepID=A0A226CZS0_FOLCA|nr:Cytochrome c oxidase subunit 3 [Folsomia candida]
MYQPPLQGYPLGYPDPQGYPAPQGRPQVPVKNPCSCCGTLTSAVKAIAITYIVLFGLATVVFALEAGGTVPQQEKSVNLDATKQYETFSAAGFFLICVSSIALLCGVKRRSIGACQMWLGVNILIGLAFVGYSLMQMLKYKEYSHTVHILIGIVITFYPPYVVYWFVQEIRLNPRGFGGAGGGGGGMMPPPPEQSFYQPAYPNAMPTSGYSVTYQSSYQAQQDVATSGG